MGEMKIKVIIYINIKLEMNICFKWSMKIIPYPVSTTTPHTQFTTKKTTHIHISHNTHSSNNFNNNNNNRIRQHHSFRNSLRLSRPFDSHHQQ